MANDEEIRRLAYSIWEQEGRPEGRDVDHYLMAKQMLEEREATSAQPRIIPPPSDGLSEPAPMAPSAPVEGNAPKRYGRRRKV